MKPSHIAAGDFAEREAQRYLQRHGLQLVKRNYRCRYGELDLILLDGECLVVVEVRYRRHTSYGGALESVTPPKQVRIQRAATHFLQSHPAFRQHPLRFDVLGICGLRGNLSFNWRRRAFYAGDG